MEKYGVAQKPEPIVEVKHASLKPKVAVCPWCGVTARVHGDVRMCPTHGSAPFEYESVSDGSK